MEENKQNEQDSCCSDSKCCCSKALMAVVLLLIGGIVGYLAGRHCTYCKKTVSAPAAVVSQAQ